MIRSMILMFAMLLVTSVYTEPRDDFSADESFQRPSRPGGAVPAVGRPAPQIDQNGQLLDTQSRREAPPINQRLNQQRQPRRARTQARTRRTIPKSVVMNTGETKRTNLSEYLKLDDTIEGLQVKNFDLQDQDLTSVVKLISKWTGKNFILDKKVRGTITILGPSQVTLGQAYQAFLSALAANGLTTIQSGKFIRIIDSGEARRSPVKTYIGDEAPEDDQFITRIFQLDFISADEVQREFRDMTTRQGKLFAYAPTNSIIITDTGSNIARIKNILDALDVRGYETTLHVLPVVHGSAKSIADMLDQIYGGSTSGSSRSGGSRRNFMRSQLEKSQGGGVISKIVPDEETNSLVILANANGFRRLRNLVSRLDVKTNDSGRIHVYYCEYAKATDLAETLSALSSSSGSSRRSSTSASRNRNKNRRGNNRGNSRRSTSSNNAISADLGEGVKITADEATNSLVITANSSEYQTIRKVIQKLDIPRQQVFIETAVLEVEVDDSTKVGTSSVVNTGVTDSPVEGAILGDSTLFSNYILGRVAEGATFPIPIGGAITKSISLGTNANGNPIAGQPFKVPTFLGLLNLLTSETNASILSTPQILAMDNKEAVFKVQDETPVQTSFSIVGNDGTNGLSGAAATGNIDYLKSGIEIKLTPHINTASGIIQLEIEHKVDSLKPATSVPAALAQVQRAKTSRVTNTTVTVKDRNYIMLGGLMTEREEESSKKVPLLGDIPILGWAFKSKSYAKKKVNLVILIKPTIIGTTLESTHLIQDRLGRRDKFIQKYMAGEERHEDPVQELKENINKQADHHKNEKRQKIYNRNISQIQRDEMHSLAQEQPAVEDYDDIDQLVNEIIEQDQARDQTRILSSPENMTEGTSLQKMNSPEDLPGTVPLLQDLQEE